MPRPRTFDETEVLDRAIDVFCRHGYEGSSMAELCSAMQLSAPSIYAAFGSKRGLFDAVLERYSHCERDHRDWVLSAPSARAVVERMLFQAADLLPGMHGAPGCLLIQGGIAAAPENADIPKLLAQQRKVNELTLRDRFDRAKVDGDLAVDADTAALASYVTAVFDGLAVKAAAGAGTPALRKIAEQALVNWQSQAVGDGASTRTRGRRREFCADDALGAAMRVFWEKGYEGASLGDLTDAMGITKPSLYACFGNKEALFLRAFERYQAENMAYVRDALDAPTARAAAEAILAGAVAAQLSEAQPRGCLAVSNALQGGDDAQIIRSEILRQAEFGHQLFVERLRRAQEDGDLPADADPEGLARLLGSVMQGIAVMGAAGASGDQMKALADSTMKLWPTERSENDAQVLPVS